MSSQPDETQKAESNEASPKKEWQEPTYSKLKAEETATGFGGFDEDSDTKTGS